MTMQRNAFTLFSLLIIAALATPATPVCADKPQKVVIASSLIPNQARKTVESGLEFLQQDAAKWRQEHKCSTCHHGTMTVWALSEAKLQGYPVPAESITELGRWTKERLEGIDKPRDTRMGWNMVSTPALYLDVMAEVSPQQAVLSLDERSRIAGHLMRHQEADGSWAWSIAPAQNRAPPHFESDEVATLLAYLALTPNLPSDEQAKANLAETRKRALAWLAKSKPTDTTQAAALRLLITSRLPGKKQELEAAIKEFLGRQNQDGGWSQIRGIPSDAYATGQALYFLSLVGVRPDRAEVQRGVAFLVATQKADGGWPMTPRAHAGAKPSTNPVPIIHLGSAWAILGLARSAPNN
jgi:hypothetical protein